MDDTMRLIVIGVIAVIFVLGIVWMLRRRRTTILRNRFGPEYDHAVREARTPAEAERELQQRQRRVEAFALRPLTREQAERFGASWKAVQARFVDDPPAAVIEADRLITEVMRGRGYPVDDPSRRLDDLSVEHAHVVDHYRSGRQIVERHEQGRASTEDLRQAMVHFRALFEELVAGTRTVGRAS
jgi:hypothetical protein